MDQDLILTTHVVSQEAAGAWQTAAIGQGHSGVIAMSLVHS